MGLQPPLVLACRRRRIHHQWSSKGKSALSSQLSAGFLHRGHHPDWRHTWEATWPSDSTGSRFSSFPLHHHFTSLLYAAVQARMAISRTMDDPYVPLPKEKKVIRNTCTHRTSDARGVTKATGLDDVAYMLHSGVTKVQTSDKGFGFSCKASCVCHAIPLHENCPAYPSPIGQTM